MPDNHEATRVIPKVDTGRKEEVHRILLAVAAALQEKGYNPHFNITGYLLSGDPAYITSHNNARNLIRRIERDEILEELLRHYLK
ncbi:MAG: IreB family regulatory phosphoprotein [Firmicutes bacterium]|nr:IreB family regulatory phosphoprotein [Bacillota bacterium]